MATVEQKLDALIEILQVEPALRTDIAKVIESLDDTPAPLSAFREMMAEKHADEKESYTVWGKRRQGWNALADAFARSVIPNRTYRGNEIITAIESLKEFDDG